MKNCSKCGKKSNALTRSGVCQDCTLEQRRDNKFFQLFEDIPYSNDRVGKGFIRPASISPDFKSTSEGKSTPEKSSKEKLFSNPFWIFLASFTILSIISFYVGYFEADWFEKNSFRDVVLALFGGSFLFAVYLAFAFYMDSDNVKNVVPKIYRRIIFVVVGCALLFIFSLLPTLD